MGTPENGGARRDRTVDLLHAMQALSQLSYGPVSDGRILRKMPRGVNAALIGTDAPERPLPTGRQPVWARALSVVRRRRPASISLASSEDGVNCNCAPA